MFEKPLHLTPRITNGLRKGDEFFLPEVHCFVELRVVDGTAEHGRQSFRRTEQ
jgi:hypothetical protein